MMCREGQRNLTMVPVKKFRKKYSLMWATSDLCWWACACPGLSLSSHWQQESRTKLAGLSFHCEALRCDWGFLSLPCWQRQNIFTHSIYGEPTHSSWKVPYWALWKYPVFKNQVINEFLCIELTTDFTLTATRIQILVFPFYRWKTLTFEEGFSSLPKITMLGLSQT